MDYGRHCNLLLLSRAVGQRLLHAGRLQHQNKRDVTVSFIVDLNK